MATKVQVLQTIAGIEYGKADPGEFMVWPDNEAESLAEKGMVKIVGKERGGNMLKPYIVGRENIKKGIIYHSISMMRDEPNTGGLLG
jgi:hypothetical protein